MVRTIVVVKPVRARIRIQGYCGCGQRLLVGMRWCPNCHSEAHPIEAEISR